MIKKLKEKLKPITEKRGNAVVEKTRRKAFFAKEVLKPELVADDKIVSKCPREIIDSTKFKEYIYGNDIPVFTIPYIRHIWRKEWKKNSALLVRMLLRNGKTTEFIVNPTRPIFEYKSGAYIIDTDFLREDIPSGMFAIQYHQDISIPINFEIDLKSLMDKITSDKSIADLKMNVNPYTLNDVVNASVVQKVLQGGQLEGQFKMMVILLVINLCITGMLLLVLGYTVLR